MSGEESRQAALGALEAVVTTMQRENEGYVAPYAEWTAQAMDAVLAEVVKTLERGYHPQNPTHAHPADFITKRFKLNGHEGLTC